MIQYPTHTPECLKRFAHYERLMALFEKQYPYYCHTCDGYGTLPTIWDGPPAHRTQPPGFLVVEERCLQCEGSDAPNCALCGQLLDADGFRQCTCPLNLGVPDAPACLCWEND